MEIIFGTVSGVTPTTAPKFLDEAMTQVEVSSHLFYYPRTLEEEEMLPTLLNLYENEPAIFIEQLLGRKKNYLLFDVSTSLDENFGKALDMIDFIVARYPSCLSEREAHHILLRTSEVFPKETLDKLEAILRNPRYKSEIRALRQGLQLKKIATSMSNILKF
jgi:hypothetical protein